MSIIVFVFSWDDCKSQEKLETMLLQNLGAQTKSIMVFSEVAYPLDVHDLGLGCIVIGRAGGRESVIEQ